jgi:hypothetical protein
MSRNEIAVHSFSLLTEISNILYECHKSGSELKYKISKKSGYEIHITVEPPAANSNNPDTAQIAAESAN